MTMARMPLRWWSAALSACALLAAAGSAARSGQQKPGTEPIQQAPPPTKVPVGPAPVFSPQEVFPPDTEVLDIDLPTALQLANAGNPTIALARLRVAEAYARLKQAQ